MSRVARFVSFSFIAVCIAGSAQAFQCGPEESEEIQFQKASAVIFVRVKSSELVEISRDGEAYEFTIAQYKIIESFKGENTGDGKVIDHPVGPGTGFIGLVSGIYYLFFLLDEANIQGIPIVNICIRKLSTFNPAATGVKARLAILRKLAEQYPTREIIKTPR